MSNFELFFRLAARDQQIQVRLNVGFDSGACEVGKMDAGDFLGTLDYLFKKAVAAS